MFTRLFSLLTTDIFIPNYLNVLDRENDKIILKCQILVEIIIIEDNIFHLLWRICVISFISIIYRFQTKWLPRRRSRTRSIAFNLSIKGIVVNQLSKHKVWCFCWGRCFTKCITDPSAEQFSAPMLPFPLYMQEEIVHHSCLTSSDEHLEAPLHRFLRVMYCRIPLCRVLAGMICSSMDITFSCSILRQLDLTISSIGRILKSLSCLFTSLDVLSTKMNGST